MAINTAIEWCDSTLNLSMGCDGCELWNRKRDIRHCYAGMLTDRYGPTSSGYPSVFEEPKLYLNRLDAALKWPDLTNVERPEKPWLNGYPRLIFLGDMGDTWTESLDTEKWILPCLERMADSVHCFLMLTKLPKRMAEFSQKHPLPKNVWPMTTVTSQARIKRAEWLTRVIGGGPKGISCEPLLGKVDLSRYLFGWDPITLKHGPGGYCDKQYYPKIQWVISGGESGKGARPMHPNWETSLRIQCQQAGVPYFLKQWGEWHNGSFPKRKSFWAFNDGSFVECMPQLEIYDYLRKRGWTTEDWYRQLPTVMCRAGKKKAGRLADGQPWNGMPEVKI